MPALRNSRHEKFAQEIAKAKTATAAMATASYSDPRNSTRLTKNDEIRRRIDELKERGAARAEVSVASLLGELEEARQTRIEAWSGVSRGAMHDGQSQNMRPHRRSSRSRCEAGAFDALTDEELIAQITQKARGICWTAGGRGRLKSGYDDAESWCPLYIQKRISHRLGGMSAKGREKNKLSPTCTAPVTVMVLRVLDAAQAVTGTHVSWPRWRLVQRHLDRLLLLGLRSISEIVRLDLTDLRCILRQR